MKKINLLCATALVASSALAQQLPNGIGTFDGSWESCYPNGGSTAVGVQPAGWMASNVYQMSQKGEFVSQEAGRDNAEGYSVKMENKFVGLNIPFVGKIGATAPGYITLGTAWSYANATNIDASDGGSYGGIDFTYKPDAVSFYMKRAHGTENASENAAVILYSWKGSTSSMVKVGSGSSTTTMIDRDKDVLGTITDGVTKSEDFELISKSENYIEGDYADWTQMIYPIEYVSESNPTKLNIIFSSSNYYTRSEMGENNTLNVDDVTLVYYSTLTSLNIGGTEIALADGVYSYKATAAMPASADEVTCTTKSPFATATVTLDETNSTVTVKVENQGGADLDGETSHTYTITCATEANDYPGYLNGTMDGGELFDNQASTVQIASYADGSCTFVLPNFSFSGMPLGDIVVENVATTTDTTTGTVTYSGSVEGMSLAGGAIVANVTLNGTITEAGICNFDIDVLWVAANMPIDVTFTTYKVPAATATYDGYINEYNSGEPSGTINVAKTLSINSYETPQEGVTLILPEITVGGWLQLGDLRVDATATTDASGITTYSGQGTHLMPDYLYEYYGNASVTVSGTIDAEGVANISFEVSLGETMTYTIVFTTSMQQMGSMDYPIFQNVTVNNEKVVTNVAGTMSIGHFYDENNTSIITLPCAVAELGETLVFGNATSTYAEGNNVYSATNGNMTLTGTTGYDDNEDEVVNFTVTTTNAAGQEVVITYTTKEQTTSSVAGIATNGMAIYGTTGAIVVAGYEGNVQVYDLAGRAVKAAKVDGRATIAMPTGIYMVTTATGTAKVVVK